MNKTLKNIKLFVIAIILGLFVLPIAFINTITVNATGEVNTISSDQLKSDEPAYLSGSDMLPSVEMDTAINHLEGKAFDIVILLQRVGKPICIAMFIISALLALFGVIMKGAHTVMGFVGMAICAVSYTCILFAPQIVQFFSTWLSS